MKKTAFLVLFALIINFLFTGCSVTLNPNNVNSTLLPTLKNSKLISTYDEKEAKITMYRFSNENGELKATYAVYFIPSDPYDMMYQPFSNVMITLNRLTKNKAKTIEEALVMEVKKHDFKKLYNDKDEYIIGNDFAIDLAQSIREFEEKMDRIDDRESRFGGRIIFPIS